MKSLILMLFLTTFAAISNASTVTTTYPCPPMPSGTYRYGDTIKDNSGNTWYVYFIDASQPNFTISGTVSWTTNMALPATNLRILSCDSEVTVSPHYTVPFSLELGLTNTSSCTFTQAEGFSCVCSSPACTATPTMPN